MFSNMCIVLAYNKNQVTQMCRVTRIPRSLVFVMHMLLNALAELRLRNKMNSPKTQDDFRWLHHDNNEI